ncbi:MAG: hypothetical protein B7Z20_11870 [Sphingobium sp. 32-64-5]|nr:MAG: hypothetical protein B7Z20_11870 [Sphingobium sp. 32-64-5]
MTRMEADLGTRLDWRAVEHWNTGNPHVHIIVRGVGEDGQNLVISRDYIREGMRAQAREIVTQELGLRSDLDIRQSLERQVEAERWTEIDRDLSRTMQRDGLIDMAPEPGVRPDGDHALRMGRLRKLERLGLASEIAPGQWTLAGDAQAALRELGERDDIIKRMHKAMTDRGIDRGAASYVLDADPAQPVIGRLVDRGLHDELTGGAYAIVDGIDGRTHHVRFSDIEATGDCKPGAIVELRHFEDRKGRRRVALAVRLRIEAVEDREAVRRGTTLFALPIHAAEGAKLIWGTADAIWTALGDTSRDLNWYSKRATLSGVYSATVLYWLGDDSPGHQASWDFLDRRIEDVMSIEKMKAALRDNPLSKGLMQGPLKFMEKIRKPMVPDDLPGRVMDRFRPKT